MSKVADEGIGRKSKHSPTGDHDGTGKARDAIEFARDKFLWLRQVACDSGLSRFAVCVAILLLDYFSRRRGGVAFPKQGIIAEKLSTWRQRVNEAIAELVARGHLSSKRRGRGRSNLYLLVLKTAEEPTKEPAKEADHDVRNPGLLDIRTSGQNEPLDAAARAGASFGSARPRGEEEKEGGVSEGKNYSDRQGGDRSKEKGFDTAGGSNEHHCSDAQLDALRAAWRRDAHLATDGKRIAVAAQRKALDDALRSGVAFGNILVAAKKWGGAYDIDADGRRYLPPLQDWLSAKGWESKPTRQQLRARRRANGGSHRKATPRPNYFYEEAGVEVDADGTARLKGGLQ